LLPHRLRSGRPAVFCILPAPACFQRPRCPQPRSTPRPHSRHGACVAVSHRIPSVSSFCPFRHLVVHLCSSSRGHPSLCLHALRRRSPVHSPVLPRHPRLVSQSSSPRPRRPGQFFLTIPSTTHTPILAMSILLHYFTVNCQAHYQRSVNPNIGGRGAVFCVLSNRHSEASISRHASAVARILRKRENQVRHSLNLKPIIK